MKNTTKKTNEIFSLHIEVNSTLEKYLSHTLHSIALCGMINRNWRATRKKKKKKKKSEKIIFISSLLSSRIKGRRRYTHSWKSVFAMHRPTADITQQETKWEKMRKFIKMNEEEKKSQQQLAITQWRKNQKGEKESERERGRGKESVAKWN